MTQYTPNPPWVDKVLSKHWYALQDRVGSSFMPVCKVTKKGKRQACTEYGCGHYGCVLPTGDRGVVCKVTSDPTEAAFVAAAFKMAKIGGWPPGMIRYFDLVQTPETYRRRPVYVIWRAEAFNVGKIYQLSSYDKRYEKKYGFGGCRELLDNLALFLESASVIRNKMKASRDPEALIDQSKSLHQKAWEYYVDGRLDDHLSPAYQIAIRKIALEQLSEVMEHTHCGSLVGQALGFYLEQGMVLADVHYGNIGEITPHDHSSWELAITDPGHMVPLDKKWLNVKIPTL